MSRYSESANKRLLFLINNPDFFISHRLPLGVAAQGAGYEVHIAAPEGPGADRLRAMGFTFHPIRLSRSGSSPMKEALSFLAIHRLYRRLRPQIVHHVTIKPVLYGTLAARLTRVPRVVNAFSGLGFVFIQKGFKATLRRFLVNQCYRWILRHPSQRAIFQNEDDRAMALRNGWIRKGEAVLIRGAGVDLKLFSMTPEPALPPVVLFPARMLWDKGLREFVDAAHLLHQEGVSARFVLVGSCDHGNPASADDEWLRTQEAAGTVEWWGNRDDMNFVFTLSHIVCLPSYREGLPKSLIEAAACGKPIVTTDVPGCREVIIPNQGGLLVPAGEFRPLADALRLLLADAERRAVMGRNNRLNAENHFGVERIVAETLRLYGT